MQTTTFNGCRFATALAAALAAATLALPAHAAVADTGSTSGAEAPVGYRIADGAVERAPGAPRDGWEGRFHAPASTIGYRAADGHPGPRTDVTAIRDGWDTGPRRPESVIGYRAADGSVPEIVSAPTTVPVADDGFHWSDAGAGAGMMLGAMLLALLGNAASRRRRRIAHA